MLVWNALQVNLMAGLVGLALIVSAWAFYRLRMMENNLQVELEKIRSDLNSTTHGSLGMGKRLVDVEKKLQGTLARQEEVEQGYSPYAKATLMLGSGSDLNEVIKTCGISRPEAELMQLMHRQMKRCGPTHK